MSLFRCAQEIA
jgi:hypothetical protein